uniref:Uncharacterized protein n=1 Tax=Trichogramma kaykai TaxID=54128 RepID=A0ABD2VUX9_9HYME
MADLLTSCRNNYQPVDVDTRDNMDWTSLHHAINHGHKRVMELLLRENADPNVASKTHSFNILFADA